MRYLLTEFEPVFDAADFIRCGRDIFAMRSNVTNLAGIAWLERHLGSAYRMHTLEFRCRTPMHIDSSFMPLRPGKLLINPDYLDVAKLPPMFKSWDILIAPRLILRDEVHWFGWIGYTTLGFVAMLFVCVCLAYPVRLFVLGGFHLAGAPLDESRHLLLVRVLGGAATTLASVLTVVGVRTALEPPLVRDVEIVLDRWP